MTTTYEHLILDKNNAIATLTLNRPKSFNAFNSKLRKELFSAVTELENDADIRVVIIKGAGPGFSAGADLTEAPPYPISDQIDYEYKPFIEKIHYGKKIYIAQVHNNASGAGAGLALACDLLIMDDAAALYMAFAAITLVPDCGTTWQLLHGMGRRRALASILESDKISAQDCHTYGLANKIVPLAELDQAGLDWAQKLAEIPNETATATKQLLHQQPFTSLTQAISNESQAQTPLITHKNFKDAVARFFAKRKS